MNFFEKIINRFAISTKTYLVLANIVLAILAIIFSNLGYLPFKSFGDFAFFAFLGLVLAIYRPGWSFLFFVGTLVLENINLAPAGLGVALHPYQFFAIMTIVGIAVQYFSKRLPFVLPKLNWLDFLAFVFAVAGFLSSIVSLNKGASFKQSLVAVSFVAIYFLVRVFVQSLDDVKRILPFFLSSGLVIIFYGIWQNVRFLHGAVSFEVMPGRPNATFTEADWLGIYLVFLLSIIFAIIFYESKKTRIFNFQFLIFQFLNYTFVTAILISLILTVSRSAWLGAILIAVGFLKIMLVNGSLKISEWQWKNFLRAMGLLIVAGIFSVGIVYVFSLTNFQLFNRAQSTGGLQKIIIACSQNHSQLPETIGNISDLPQYGCRHINLEDINAEQKSGNQVLEINRPDPNVGIRGEIYQKSFAQIKAHPLLGIGWGSISAVLGTDERGAGLNASNIFLEVWLGAGLLGFLSFVVLLGYIFFKSALFYFKGDQKVKIVSAGVALALFAVILPNLFNSGIFLGFVWLFLAIAISLLSDMPNAPKNPLKS